MKDQRQQEEHTEVTLDTAIITLELERYDLLRDFRKLCAIRKLTELQEIVRASLEQDIASIEQALNVLREAVSQDRGGTGCSQKQRE